MPRFYLFFPAHFLSSTMAFEITEIYYPKTRRQWRSWLQRNHLKKSEIWLMRYLKATGKPCISYDELVEECLCFGWIDGVKKKFEPESNVQRITPRRKKTFLSELNRQRVWKLQHKGLMTPAGITPIEDQIGHPNDPWEFPDWIKKELMKEEAVWENFESFSPFYQRLKIGWIQDCGTSRREESERRLRYLLKMTGKGKKYGTIPYTNEQMF